MKPNHQLEYRKGYTALDILTMLGYIVCVIYVCMGFAAMGAGFLPGILLILEAVAGFIAVYVGNRIGHAVFIARDLALERKDVAAP